MGFGGISVWGAVVFLIIAGTFFGLLMAALVKYVFGLGKRDQSAK